MKAMTPRTFPAAGGQAAPPSLMQATELQPDIEGSSRTSGLPPITEAQKVLVQKSFALVAPIADHAAALFYDRLFKLDPGLQSLFKSDMTEQRRKLMATLHVAVAGLDTPDQLLPAVRELGHRHRAYGVADSNYETVGEALLWTLEQGLGSSFNDEVREAWTAVYGLLSGVMKDASGS